MIDSSPLLPILLAAIFWIFIFWVLWIIARALKGIGDSLKEIARKMQGPS